MTTGALAPLPMVTTPLTMSRVPTVQPLMSTAPAPVL
jgi:hypothetical protein